MKVTVAVHDSSLEANPSRSVLSILLPLHLMQELYGSFIIRFWGDRASMVAQIVKNLPIMQETWVGSLGWEDPLEKRKATDSSILAWRISYRGAWQTKVHGVTKSRLSNFYLCETDEVLFFPISSYMYG